MVANYRPLRAPVYFTCLAQSSDPDLGTVTGSGKYLAGKTVTLTAHPGERADFAGWMDEEGQLVSQESRYSFSITQDIILTAQFVRIYAVLVSVEPEGSGTVQGAGNYRQGQEAVLAAQESEGWLFTAWTEQGETVEASPEYRFVVDRDRTLAARFAVRCIITLLPGLEGAGTATGAGAYPYGAKVTLTASPAEGYRFLGWQNAAGETVSAELSYTFTITEDVVFTPLFAGRLPAGYTELEYIQANAKCAINTGFQVNFATTRIFLDLLAEQAVSNSEYVLLTKTVSGIYFYMSRKTGNQLYGRYDVNGSFSMMANITGNRMAIDCDFVQGKLRAGETAVALTRINRTLTVPLHFFGLAETTTPIPAKLYSAQIYTSDKLERDFVPCLNPAGKAGLYDLVGEQFYGNILSGSFTPGPAV